MYAITVKAPWAQMFFDSDKQVENREWALPRHLLGQTVAIHVSVSPSDWRDFAFGLDWCPKYDQRYVFYAQIAKYVAEHGGPVGHKSRPPEAGLIIGTVQIVGGIRVVNRDPKLLWPISKHEVTCRLPGPAGDLCDAAAQTLWFTGEHGHVYGSAKRLRVPVGPVRGQLGYWKLDNETEAAAKAAMEQ